jgi:hypothetical protein
VEILSWFSVFLLVDAQGSCPFTAARKARRYHYETGKPFIDLKTGFAQACKKAGITNVTTFGCHRNHALYAHKSRFKACRSCEARMVWS